MSDRTSDLVLQVIAPVLALAMLVAPGQARADDAADTAQARTDFMTGVEFVHKALWSDALIAFERSAKLHASAVTTFNIGTCERALGEYARARSTLSQALAANDAAQGAELPESVVSEIKGYLSQIDGLLATAVVTLDPAGAAISVDGRPLQADPGNGAAGAPPTVVAGVRPPGPAEPAPAASFRLVLDPGAHVLTLSRPGYTDAVVNRTFTPGSTTELRLELDRMPATLHIASNPAGAVVVVNGLDVGTTPVDVPRPAGSYRVVVKDRGFVTYESSVVAQPGESLNLRAELTQETHPLTTRWWFWTAAGVVLVGAAAGTYFLTRSEPAPERPPLNGGSLGWTLNLH